MPITAEGRKMKPPADHPPPHDAEAEAGALACVLSADGGEAGTMLEAIRPEDFYDHRHRTIYGALKALHAERKPLDVISLTLHLKCAGKLADAGGDDYLQRLPDATPSAANWPAWIEQLKDLVTRRTMLANAVHLATLARDRTTTTATLADAAHRVNESYCTTIALPEPLSWRELQQPVDYANNLLGNRFLERGCGLILYGPAGVGKSVAGYQACIEWSAGLAAFHIRPSRPLKIVVLQTEDTKDDLREAWAGILGASIFSPQCLALAETNLVVLPAVPAGDEHDLARLIDAAATKYSPDMIHPNPLLAWCSRDPTRELGHLLYQVIDPLIKRHQIGLFGVHHTPKTNRLDTSGYGAHDHQYLAAGDARVTNWPRAMIQIEPVAGAESVYCFRLTKRWQRAGWEWDGKPTKERYFKHAKPEVRWLDATPAEVQKAETAEDYTKLLDVLPGPNEEGISRERIRSLAKNRLNIGKGKADDWLKLGIEDKLIDRLQKTIPKSQRKEALFRRAKDAACAP